MSKKAKIKSVCITYPPFDCKEKPILLQNKFMSWFTLPTYSYPMISAMAATMLKNAGYKVSFFDSVARNTVSAKWLDFISETKPDMIFLEAKTYNINYYYDVIDSIKKILPATTVVLAGAHVCALPLDAFEKSSVDYVLGSGDYDFQLLNLVEYINGKEKLGGGVYSRGRKIKYSGIYKNDEFLDNMPFIDRDLTHWKLYSSGNRGVKKSPSTFISSARDCFYNKCSFCAKENMYETYKLRSPQNVIEEILLLEKRYEIKEIIDDSATFPAGEWLTIFSQMLIDTKINKKLIFDCNMAFGKVEKETYSLMKKAGFRALRFGLESANQITFEKINKNINIKEAIEECKVISKMGLEVYINVMIGYPWESEDDIKRTLSLVKTLLNKGYASSMQANFIIPYPGTKLFEECEKNGTLTTKDWYKYNMSSPVIKSPVDNDKLKTYMQKFYNTRFHPRYLAAKILSIRDIDDIKYFIRLAKTPALN